MRVPHCFVVLVLLFSGCIGNMMDFDGDGTVDNEDCANENPYIHPGADEVCDNAVDDDCDGEVDCGDSDCGAWIDCTGDDDDSADDDTADR